MTLKHPPRFATWLLLHFGCSSDNDAMLGDLEERYCEGKRPSWYWKQTVIAIVVSAFDDIYARKTLALRAILAGCFVQMGIEFLMARYFPLVPYWVPLRWWGTEFEAMVACAFALSLGIAGGLTIVRLYPRRGAIVLFYILVMQALGVLTATVSGLGLGFYLAANVSLTFGILTGALWIDRLVRAADRPTRKRDPSTW